MSILIKGMDMLKDGTYTSNIHVKGGKAVLDNPIGLGYFELVEVVRCKDCKLFEQNREKEFGNCLHHQCLAYLTDFCSWGERKEDEVH